LYARKGWDDGLERKKTHENLLVGVARRDGARVLEQAVRQGALAVVDVGDDAKVAVALDGDRRDALLELGGAALLGAVLGRSAGGAALR
jgi:hypothetical protein